MTATGRWLRRFHPSDHAATQLLCLPHAGGSATYYHPMSRALSPEIDVLVVQYPGRQERRGEPCVESVDELADHVVAAVEPLAGRPLTLFGHSLGAMLGFEVARRLERAGVVPAGLFVSAGRAPRRRLPAGEPRTRDDADLLAELRALSGTDSSLLDDDEVVRLVLPALRSDYKAVETYTYRPGRPLRCPIFALVGDNDPKVTVDEAAGWREHTRGGFDLAVFPGGHFYLGGNLPDVVRRLRAHARAVRGPQRRSA